MEELGSTGQLDLEIMEDARRRAEEHHAQAARRIARLDAEWDQRLQSESEQLRQEYRMRQLKLDQDARDVLPLEKGRLRLRFESESLQSALIQWFSSLDDVFLLSLFAPRLGRVGPFFATGTARVELTGLGASGPAWVRHTLPGLELVITSVDLPSGGAPNPLFLRGLRIHATDHRTDFVLTCRELMDELMEHHAHSLVAALFPQGGHP